MVMKYIKTLCLGTVIYAMCPLNAGAQVMPLQVNMPSTVDVGRQPLPEIPQVLPEVQPSVQPPQSATPELEASLAEQSFMLYGVKFTGNTVFPRSQLLTYFLPYLNSDTTVQDVFKVVSEIQQLYLDTGYTLTRVYLPDQDLSKGEVTIDVIEGYVADVIISPELSQSPLIQKIAAEIKEMRPINMLRLERLLMTLSSRPGLETASVLVPPSAEDDLPQGAIKIMLEPRSQSRNSAYVSIANSGSNYIGPWQIQGGVRHGRLFGTDIDVGMAVGLTPKAKELRQVSFDANMPVLGTSGAVAGVSASRTHTAPGENLKELDVKAVSNRFGMSFLYPLIMQRDERLSVGVNFDYQNIGTDMLAQSIVSDRLRTLSFNVNYNIYDKYNGNNVLRAELRRGLDIMGARGKGSANPSRADGEVDFTKITMGASRIQQIGGGFDAFFAVDGQYAFNPLLSSEEFGYGGSNIGRGYDPSEIVGDSGIATVVELRYTFAPAFWPETYIQPFVFYDIGKAWNKDGGMLSGASSGLGSRFSFPFGTTASLGVAFPLTRASNDPPKYSNPKGPRYLMSLQHNL